MRIQAALVVLFSGIPTAIAKGKVDDWLKVELQRLKLQQRLHGRLPIPSRFQS
jgi:hypothetical protein